MTDMIRVGNVEIVAVLDMVPPPRDPTIFIREQPREAWAPYEAEVLENGLLQLYYGSFFVRSGGQTVLVDTGMGPGPHAHLENRTGNLLGALSDAGVKADDVDIVIHTHLHPDHVGWNVDSSGDANRPFFPSARYLGPRKDWEHFMQADVLPTAPHISQNVIPLDELGLIEFIDDGHNVTDEITTLETPGHTPGHQVILVSSNGEKAAIIGDLIHNPVQIYEPDWCAFVDTNPDDTRRSRKAFMDRAESEEMVVAAGHFHPDRHIGRFVRMEGRRYWRGI
jgi:glyoxylase-like metal-dependent hydrolase (beta-lactamase superfamily II)